MIDNLKKYWYYSLIFLIIILGAFLRVKMLLANPSFWHDECSLGWNIIHKNYGGFFGVLRFLQMAPPFFMVLSKLSVQILGITDFNLRIVPFFFGMASLILFFFLSDKIFKNKVSTVASTFLFAINQTMCNYSSEFKHYSCDVFFTILVLYLFFDLLSKDFSLKKIWVYSIIFALSIWFSFVSIFSILAGLLVFFIKQFREKQLNLKVSSVLILPLFLSSVLYLKFYVLANITGTYGGMHNYWASGFIAKNLSNLGSLFVFNINYLFFPLKLTLFAVIFISIGTYIFTKKNFYFGLVLLLTLFFECFASWLGVYPFEKRTVVFLLPVFLIFLCSIFEVLDLKHKIKSILVSALFLITFFVPVLFSLYVVLLPSPSRGYHPREMMMQMQKMIKPSDIVLINQNSNTEFAYYSYFYPVKNEIYQEPQKGKPDVLIKSLKRHRYYWFFMPYEPSATVEKWVNERRENILFELKDASKKGSLRYVYIK